MYTWAHTNAHIYTHICIHTCIGSLFRWSPSREEKVSSFSFAHWLFSYVNSDVSVWSLFCQGAQWFPRQKMVCRRYHHQWTALPFSLLFSTRDHILFRLIDLRCTAIAMRHAFSPSVFDPHHPDVSAPWAQRLSLKWNANDMLMICKNTKQGVNDHLWN